MIVIPAILESLRTLKDGTLKLHFETLELAPDKAGQLFTSANKSGFLCFKQEAFQKNELESIGDIEVDDIGLNKKSQSQRIKNVLYVCWQKDSQGYEDFELYYRFKTEQYITHMKSKLD